MSDVRKNIEKYLDVVMIVQATLQKAGVRNAVEISHAVIHDLSAGGFLVDHHPEILKDKRKTT